MIARLKQYRTYLVPLGLVAILIVSGALIIFRDAITANTAPNALQKSLQEQFPNTKITAVDCKQVVKGLCEVTAGKNLFYTTPDGRYIMIGALLDLHKKIDLTDARLKELAAVDVALSPLISAGAKQASATAEPNVKIKVTLPLNHAIIHNRGAPIKLTVFSDYACGYCRMLFHDLQKTNEFEITEYPIAILGEDSRIKARAVLCAKDPVAASANAYSGTKPLAISDCPRAGEILDANTRFAKANGIEATPTLIRSDGTLTQGYLPLEALKAFAKASS